MPLYGFVCSNAHRSTHYAKINDRDAVRQCEACGANLTRLLEAPYVRPEIAAYQSPVTGEWVNSRAQRRDDLARSGSMEYDPEFKKDAARIRAENFEKNVMGPIERTIDETTRAMVASGAIPSV
jgi:hypothetical protein